MNQKLTTALFGIVLAIIAIIPFAIPFAYFPISKFYSEATSLIGGIILFAIALFSQNKLKLSAVALAAFAFAIFMLIQPLFVHIYYLGNNHYMAMMMVILGLTAIGVTSLSENNPATKDKLLLILAWSLVISATIQAIIAYLQYTGKAANFSSWILYTDVSAGDGGNILGNIGQPNQFTDFMSVGVVALCYLYFIGQINLLVFVAYGLLFALAITFTARRGVLLYYVVMLFLIGLKWLLNRKDNEQRAQIKKIAILLAGFFVGLILVQLALPKVIALFSSTPAESLSTGLSRLSADSINGSTYRRFYEWYKAIILFVNNPFFGVGWYQYPREGIYIMLTERFMYIPQNMKLYTHCHNSLFNIMAETGIIGTLISVGYGIIYSLYLLLRRIATLQDLFIVLLTIPILVHSLLEYPLWYAYFLVLLVVLLAFAPAKYVLQNNRIIKLLGSIVILGLMTVAYNAYQANDQLSSLTQTPTDYDDYVANLTILEKYIDSNSMLALPASMVLDNYIMPGSQATNSAMSPQDQLKYIDILANDMPYPGAFLKQIIVHKMAGDDKGANYYANVLVHAYPYYQQQFIQQLSSDKAFADIVKTLQSFHYQDKSDLSKILEKAK